MHAPQGGCLVTTRTGTAWGRLFTFWVILQDVLQGLRCKDTPVEYEMAKLKSMLFENINAKSLEIFSLKTPI